MKKLLCILLISILFIGLAIPVYAESKLVEVKLNNMLVTFDVPPTSVQGRTLVPLRAIFEELGMEVLWDGETKSITGSKAGVTVKLQQDSKTAYVNGNQVTLDVPAQAIKGRILVPVRFIAESTGAKVFWYGKTSTVYISTSTDKTLTLENIISSVDSSNSGHKLAESGKLDDALKDYDKAIKIDPFNFSAHYWKGLLNKSKGMNKEALECFDQAISINKKPYFIYEEKAKLLYLLDRYKESAESYEEAVKSNKDKYTISTFENLGDGLYDDKKYEDSIYFFNIVINQYPDKADYAYYSKSMSLFDLQKYDEALMSIDKSIEINPNDDYYYSMKGLIYEELEKLEEALEYYDKAIKVDPKEPQNYNDKGDILNDLDRHEEALEYFNKAISMDSSIADFFNDKGNVLYALERYEEAIESYNKAIELYEESESSYAYFGKSLCYINLNNINECLVNLKKAIELDSSLKEDAKNYPEFNDIRTNKEFIQLVY